MPLYNFKCTKCKLSYDELFRMNEKKNSVCPQCESKAERIFSVGMPNYGFKPYRSYNLSPNPNGWVDIESRDQKLRLMREHGLEESGKTDRKEI